MGRSRRRVPNSLSSSPSPHQQVVGNALRPALAPHQQLPRHAVVARFEVLYAALGCAGELSKEDRWQGRKRLVAQWCVCL